VRGNHPWSLGGKRGVAPKGKGTHTAKEFGKGGARGGQGRMFLELWLVPQKKKYTGVTNSKCKKRAFEKDTGEL